MTLAAIHRLGAFLRQRARLLTEIGWVSGSFAAAQVLRLATNIALAWLLEPALLGTMLLINTLRTGAELLTDVGIGQSIVNNRRGEDPDFLNTAWTLKIIRGFVLCAIGLAATVPLANLYDDPQLEILLPVTAGIFILSGFSSPSRSVLQKRVDVKKIALFNVIVALANATITIVLAIISPTIWALIGSLWLSTLVTTIGTFFLIRGLHHRLRFEREAAREILHFGKWIFFASLIYFAAMNFDRLYFASVIPYGLLGIYGIARTFSDTALQVFQRIGDMLIFPKISAIAVRDAALRDRIKPLRLIVLLTTAVALGVAVALADIFIIIAYDDRYLQAGIFLTILLFGSWVGILGALADAMMMGIGKPSIVATSNLAKFMVIVLALPLLLPRYGIIAALIAFIGAETVRYAVLVSQKRAVGLGFTRQDILATVLFIVVAIVLRELSGLVGLTDGLSGWLEAARTAHI